MSKPLRAWAIKHRDVGLRYGTHAFRADAIARFVRDFEFRDPDGQVLFSRVWRPPNTVEGQQQREVWKQIRAMGYRAVKVTVTEVEDG